MTKQHANTYLNRFLNPSGLVLLLSIILMCVNAYASTQLLPLIRHIDNLDQRVTNLENNLTSTSSIIIPRGELDQKFQNLENQLTDIKETLRSR